VRDDTYQTRRPVLNVRIGGFWSGDIGLTLITISLAILIFVITPFREAGLPGRFLFELTVVALMIFGALTAKQSYFAKASVIVVVLITAVVLAAGRLHPTLFLHQLGSFLVTVVLLLYVRVVLLVMFRGGPMTWSRIQGGISAYLLLGMAWASAFQFVEQILPGSFSFVTAPADIDQLTSKLTYFSFATLTTVGSTIAPVHPIARSLTIAEAVVGQLFPPTLIGALVAMAMGSRNRS